MDLIQHIIAKLNNIKNDYSEELKSVDYSITIDTNGKK